MAENRTVGTECIVTGYSCNWSASVDSKQQASRGPVLSLPTYTVSTTCTGYWIHMHRVTDTHALGHWIHMHWSLDTHAPGHWLHMHRVTGYKCTCSLVTHAPWSWLHMPWVTGYIFGHRLHMHLVTGYTCIGSLVTHAPRSWLHTHPTNDTTSLTPLANMTRVK